MTRMLRESETEGSGKEPRGLALKVSSFKLEKDKSMEIITACGGVAFAVVLAALAVSPQALVSYFELRAHEQQQRHSEAAQ